jgi:transposase
MPKPISNDLRQRIIAYVEAGHSARSAARHYGIGESTATKLVGRYLKSGRLDPLPMGRPTGQGKLAPYKAFLKARIEAEPDMTMPELAACLYRDQNVQADPATLSRLLKRMGLTYKKNTGRHRT